MTAEYVAGKLGHSFADRGLFRTALTHRSFGVPNNERLEFLGDGILDFVIADEDIVFLKTIEQIKDYGDFSFFPVFGGKK